MIKYKEVQKSGFGCGIIIKKDDKYLMGKRSMNCDSGQGLFGFPGGKIEIGETPVEAAIRELKEETNLDVKEENLIFLGTFVNSNSGTDFVFTVNEYENELIKQDEEVDYFDWKSHEEILDENDIFPESVTSDILYNEISINNKEVNDNDKMFESDKFNVRYTLMTFLEIDYILNYASLEEEYVYKKIDFNHLKGNEERFKYLANNIYSVDDFKECLSYYKEDLLKSLLQNDEDYTKEEKILIYDHLNKLEYNM